jgi:hypothetical protein
MPSHDWYDGNPDLAAKYQGDIVADVVVFVPPPADKGMYLLRPSTPVTVAEALVGKVPKAFLPRPESATLDPPAWGAGYEFVLAKAQRRLVQVVTQTCDIENRSVIQVVPVLPLTEFGAENKRQSLRNGEIGYLNYLPADDPLIESYSDLSRISWVPKASVTAAPLVKRLTPAALMKLQQRLARLHGRPFSFNSGDEVPQSGPYLCMSCFAKLAQISQLQAVAGQMFPTCDKCESAAWIKQVPATT